jgi:hypothetical protein
MESTRTPLSRLGVFFHTRKLKRAWLVGVKKPGLRFAEPGLIIK